jgi:hypothetical protein
LSRTVITVWRVAAVLDVIDDTPWRMTSSRAIRSVDVHAELEPSRLLRDDGKRPDGATLDPWHRGRYLVWDLTCPDALAPSHLLRSSTAAGSAAVVAEAKKLAKYQELVRSDDYTFVPNAI